MWKIKIVKATTADSLIPMMASMAKKPRTKMVPSSTLNVGYTVCRYSTAVLDEMTAVAI